MSTYRVTVQVTTDVEVKEYQSPTTEAISKISELLGDAVLATREAWITGIARDPLTREYLIFEQSPNPYIVPITRQESIGQCELCDSDIHPDSGWEFTDEENGDKMCEECSHTIKNFKRNTDK